MPVYHFTFHAFGSWLPDRPEGYIIRNKGWQPPSEASTVQYRSNMNQDVVAFTDDQQQLLLQTLIDCQTHQCIKLYAIATEPTHIHAVTAWTDDREPEPVRAQMKYSMTRALVQAFGKRKWFVQNAGQTQVRDDEHLYELVHHYLPKHHHFWQPSSNNKTDG